LKTDHIFVSGDRVCFIDLDSVVLGDPVRDPHTWSRTSWPGSVSTRCRRTWRGVQRRYSPTNTSRTSRRRGANNSGCIAPARSSRLRAASSSAKSRTGPTRSRPPSPRRTARRPGHLMDPTTDLPDDAALPGIVAMRALGVTRALAWCARSSRRGWRMLPSP